MNTIVESKFCWCFFASLYVMKLRVEELPSNPFAQNKDPKEVMRELLKNSKSLSREEAIRRMKQAAEEQKKSK